MTIPFQMASNHQVPANGIFQAVGTVATGKQTFILGQQPLSTGLHSNYYVSLEPWLVTSAAQGGACTNEGIVKVNCGTLVEPKPGELWGADVTGLLTEQGAGGFRVLSFPIGFGADRHVLAIAEPWTRAIGSVSDLAILPDQYGTVEPDGGTEAQTVWDVVGLSQVEDSAKVLIKWDMTGKRWILAKATCP
jgi:hypothetical protein